MHGDIGSAEPNAKWRSWSAEHGPTGQWSSVLVAEHDREWPITVTLHRYH